MEQTISNISLNKIKASPLNPRATFTPKEMQELVESIKFVGVRSPIKVRKAEKDTYEIVFGERRYRASQEAGLTDIPCMVVEMTDDEVEKEQFIENMVRADVHPMDEAVKFASMISREHNPIPSADIALMINKSQGYVLQRIELTNLLPILQKEFWAGEFNIGVAIEIARLSKDQQKELRSELKWNDKYKNVKSVRSYIQEKIVRDLKTAPFDTTNPDLNPKMGICTTCPQRSGANRLFEDIKSKNTCFNGDCFALKSTVHMLGVINEMLIKYPTMVFVKHHRDPNEVIMKKLKDEKATIINSYTDGWSINKTKEASAIKGLYISGEKAGQITTFYREADAKGKKQDVNKLAASGANTDEITAELDSQITAIKDRQKRAVELDAEKVWSKIHTDVIPTIELVSTKYNSAETAAVLYAMYASLKYSATISRDRFLQVFAEDKLKYTYGGVDEKLIESFGKATPAQISECNKIFIINILDTASGSHQANTSTKVLYNFAAFTKLVEMAAVITEQDEVAAKRIVRATERIDLLKAQKKELLAKQTKKVAKVKA